MSLRSGRRSTHHHCGPRKDPIHRKTGRKRHIQREAKDTKDREEPNRMVKYASCHNHRILSENHRPGLVKVQSARDGGKPRSGSTYIKHRHSRSTFDEKHHTRRKTKYLEDMESAEDSSDDTKHNTHLSNRSMEHILKSVRREYQQQVDHVISKWKELLDRCQMESTKYRNLYHLERSRNKQLEPTVDQLRSKLKKYKNKDSENQTIIFDLQQQLAAIFDDLTEIATPSLTPRGRYAPNRYDYNYSYNVKHRRNSISGNTPLKVSLPAPAPVPTPHRYYKGRRKSQSVTLLPPPNATLTYYHYHPSKEEDCDEAEEDMVLRARCLDKIVKTRDDLKKILDGIDDTDTDTGHNNNNTNDESISISIKYKDKLFKNKSHTMKVHQSMRFNDFIHHLSDSININPNVIQIQHDTNMMDVHNTETMNASLAQLDIDNFDHVSLYINYNKLLHDADANADAHKECLYAIITDCILQNDSHLMLQLLSDKIAEIMECEHVRLYFKWNDIVQIIYPQSHNIRQQIIINLSDDNYDNGSLLMHTIHEKTMKCFRNPSQIDSKFNQQFNYKMESTLIAPLWFDQTQLIGIIQLINKANAPFTARDKQRLLPFTNIFGIALKVLYHVLPHHDIFNALDAMNRVKVNNRGVSRRISEHVIQNNLTESNHTISRCIDDMRHNSVSRNVSPICDNYLSTASSALFHHNHSHNGVDIDSSYASSTTNIVHNEDSTTDIKRKRNESTQYFIRGMHRHDRHSMVINLSNAQNQQLVTPPTPTHNV